MPSVVRIHLPPPSTEKVRKITDSVLLYYVFGIMSFHISIAGFSGEYEKARNQA